MKRYEPEINSELGTMEECDDGEWIKFTDYEQAVRDLVNHNIDLTIVSLEQQIVAMGKLKALMLGTLFTEEEWTEFRQAYDNRLYQTRPFDFKGQSFHPDYAYYLLEWHEEAK